MKHNVEIETKISTSQQVNKLLTLFETYLPRGNKGWRYLELHKFLGRYTDHYIHNESFAKFMWIVLFGKLRKLMNFYTFMKLFESMPSDTIKMLKIVVWI